MAPLRLFCSTCDIVRVRPDRAIVTVGVDRATLQFLCSGCRGLESVDVQSWAVEVFADAGCTVIGADGPTRGSHPSVGLGPISEAEIDLFVSELDADDWARSLR